MASFIFLSRLCVCPFAASGKTTLIYWNLLRPLRFYLSFLKDMLTSLTEDKTVFLKARSKMRVKITMLQIPTTDKDLSH